MFFKGIVHFETNAPKKRRRRKNIKIREGEELKNEGEAK